MTSTPRWGLLRAITVVRGWRWRCAGVGELTRRLAQGISSAKVIAASTRGAATEVPSADPSARTGVRSLLDQTVPEV